MPALKKVSKLPDGFLAARQIGNAVGEAKDCTVVAMTVTTGLPYATCRDALTAAGRKPGKGASWAVQSKAYAALGFKMVPWSSAQIVAMLHSYPKKGIAGITTHQPRRFAKQWAGTGALTLHSNGHVSACVDGVVHDWAINSSLRVLRIHSIVKA